MRLAKKSDLEKSDSILVDFIFKHRLKMRNAAFIIMLISVSVLSIFGIVMLYSISSAQAVGYDNQEKDLIKQSIWILVGAFVAFGVYFIDYRKICVRGKKILLLSIIPLMYLATISIMSMAGVKNESLNLMPFVREINGAYRWFTFGSFSIQPSEFIKLFIIIFIAGYYGLNPRRAHKFKEGILFPLLILGVVLFLVLMSGSLSITAITSMVIIAMLFVAGIKFRYHAILFVSGVCVIIAVLFLSPTRMARVQESWLNPEASKKDKGYQLYHSRLALGNGGFYGRGFNNGLIKQKYLPESHTDFIVANIGEELGFVGILTLLIAYLVLIASCLAISTMATDRVGTLLGFGVSFSIGIHIMMNLCVVSGALPTTGVTAPFISYGGSSMVVTWIGIGLLASLVRVSNNEDRSKEQVKPVKPSSSNAIDITRTTEIKV